ncbi:hypothetical protein M3Y97_01097500 [Aphelenchoides bicaudatus]|nr:hypothetical protein M3Y97_01097500 [Aphelenchoides bicaudatus]
MKNLNFLLFTFFVCLKVSLTAEILERLDIKLLRLLTVERVRFSECVVENSIRQGSRYWNATNECIQGTRMQLLLPALYMDQWIDDFKVQVSCMQQASISLVNNKQMKQHSSIATQLVQEGVTCDLLKSYIEKDIQPFVCKLKQMCPNKKSQQMIDGIFVEILSIQQYARDEKLASSEEKCQLRIQINPKLYHFGVDYNENFSFLTDHLMC